MDIKKITDKELVWIVSYDDPAKAIGLLGALTKAKSTPEDHSIDLITWMHGSVDTRIAMLMEWHSYHYSDAKLSEIA